MSRLVRSSSLQLRSGACRSAVGKRGGHETHSTRDRAHLEFPIRFDQDSKSALKRQRAQVESRGRNRRGLEDTQVRAMTTPQASAGMPSSRIRSFLDMPLMRGQSGGALDRRRDVRVLTGRVRQAAISGTARKAASDDTRGRSAVAPTRGRPPPAFCQFAPPGLSQHSRLHKKVT